MQDVSTLHAYLATGIILILEQVQYDQEEFPLAVGSAPRAEVSRRFLLVYIHYHLSVTTVGMDG